MRHRRHERRLKFISACQHLCSFGLLQQREPFQGYCGLVGKGSQHRKFRAAEGAVVLLTDHCQHSHDTASRAERHEGAWLVAGLGVNERVWPSDRVRSAPCRKTHSASDISSVARLPGVLRVERLHAQMALSVR